MPFSNADVHAAAALQVQKCWLMPILREPVPSHLEEAAERVDSLLEARQAGPEEKLWPLH